MVIIMQAIQSFFSQKLQFLKALRISPESYLIAYLKARGFNLFKHLKRHEEYLHHLW
jgi:hypothetical protein